MENRQRPINLYKEIDYLIAYEKGELSESDMVWVSEQLENDSILQSMVQGITFYNRQHGENQAISSYLENANNSVRDRLLQTFYNRKRKSRIKSFIGIAASILAILFTILLSTFLSYDNGGYLSKRTGIIKENQDIPEKEIHSKIIVENSNPTPSELPSQVIKGDRDQDYFKVTTPKSGVLRTRLEYSVIDKLPMLVYDNVQLMNISKDSITLNVFGYVSRETHNHFLNDLLETQQKIMDSLNYLVNEAENHIVLNNHLEDETNQVKVEADLAKNKTEYYKDLLEKKMSDTVEVLPAFSLDHFFLSEVVKRDKVNSKINEEIAQHIASFDKPSIIKRLDGLTALGKELGIVSSNNKIENKSIDTIELTQEATYPLNEKYSSIWVSNFEFRGEASPELFEYFHNALLDSLHESSDFRIVDNIQRVEKKSNEHAFAPLRDVLPLDVDLVVTGRIYISRTSLLGLVRLLDGKTGEILWSESIKAGQVSRKGLTKRLLIFGKIFEKQSVSKEEETIKELISKITTLLEEQKNIKHNEQPNSIRSH